MAEAYKDRLNVAPSGIIGSHGRSLTARLGNPNLLHTKALLETAQDMRHVGVLGEPAYAKITKRHLGEQISPTAQPLSANEIKALRQRARMSQAVFAHHLNVTPGYVSQLERGAKRPDGSGTCAPERHRPQRHRDNSLTQRKSESKLSVLRGSHIESIVIVPEEDS